MFVCVSESCEFVVNLCVCEYVCACVYGSFCDGVCVKVLATENLSSVP